MLMWVGTLLVWVAFCTMIGLIGRKKAFGFWGFFVISFLLTPVTGFLILLFLEILSLLSESRKAAQPR